MELIEAPSNLGLRPLWEGHVPGAWRAPQALYEAGLHQLLRPIRVSRLERPDYEVDACAGTRIRNGRAIRDFSVRLARTVAGALSAGRFPLVIGGDCSVLLGCLLGADNGRPLGLLHIDGHSDFFHPGNYDSEARLGSAAGMDLALATGRGEPLLTEWPGRDGPLVADADVIQLGEREELDPTYAFADIQHTAIRQLCVREILRIGVRAAANETAEHVRSRGLERVWLHLDVDILDQAVMPAVDCPGSPGLDFLQLSKLLSALCESIPVIGADITVFDPDIDLDGRLAKRLTECIAAGFSSASKARP